MKLYPFSALLARMKYITRWSLMHSTRPESLSEHTCDTALLAHTLCLIARRYTGTPCRPKTVAVAALYHDCLLYTSLVNVFEFDHCDPRLSLSCSVVRAPAPRTAHLVRLSRTAHKNEKTKKAQSGSIHLSAFAFVG